MSKKNDLISRLLDAFEPRRPFPKTVVEGLNIVEQGLYMVLLRHMTEAQAEASVRALQKAYPDWNELRISQVQEIGQHFRTSTRKKGTEKLQSFAPVALELKGYLQEVFQQTHSMSMDVFLKDMNEAMKSFPKMPVLGMSGGAYLAWVATKEVPAHASLVRLLDKLGLVTKTVGKKSSEVIATAVPEGREREFTIAMYEMLEFWDDPVLPSFVRMPILLETPFGKKSAEEREAAITRAEVAKKKEEERQRKEDERERQRIAAEDKKREAADKARRRAEDAAKKKAEREAARKAAIAKRDADRKAAAEAKQLAKEAAAKKKEADRKKKEEADKKAAEKAAAQKKAAALKQAAAEKAAAQKAAAKKKAEAKKAAADKKKAAAKAQAAKKKAAAKKTAKKTTTVKPAARKAAKKTTKKAPKVARR